MNYFLHLTKLKSASQFHRAILDSFTYLNNSNNEVLLIPFTLFICSVFVVFISFGILLHICQKKVEYVTDLTVFEVLNNLRNC